MVALVKWETSGKEKVMVGLVGGKRQERNGDGRNGGNVGEKKGWEEKSALL